MIRMDVNKNWRAGDLCGGKIFYPISLLIVISELEENILLKSILEMEKQETIVWYSQACFSRLVIHQIMKLQK